MQMQVEQVEQKLNFYIFRLDGRQWGFYWTGDWTAGVTHFYAPLPISYSSAGYNVVAVVGGNSPNGEITNFAFNPYGLSKIEITFSDTLSGTKYPFYYISIGK